MTCIVDAGQWRVQALALSRAGIDIRVAHLVRDVRGVAYSLQQARCGPAARAENEKDVMWSKRPADRRRRWANFSQGQVELLPLVRCAGRGGRCEDLVQ